MDANVLNKDGEENAGAYDKSTSIGPGVLQILLLFPQKREFIYLPTYSLTALRKILRPSGVRFISPGASGYRAVPAHNNIREWKTKGSLRHLLFMIYDL